MKKILKISGLALMVALTAPIGLGLVMDVLRNEVPAPGQLIDVGGYRLHIHCTGMESDLPTVIVEAGLGGPTPFYHWVQENLSRTGKVCTYDRAGLGWSEESGQPRDADTMARQLHTLLEKANIDKPVVLAGHSLAGLIMRVYTDKYPDDVVGLAFLDASHPKQNEVLGFGDDDSEEVMDAYSLLGILNSLGLTNLYNPLLAPMQGYLPDEIIGQLAATASGAYFDASNAEMAAFDDSARQAHQTKNLGDRPIVVVTAGQLVEDEYLPDHVDAYEMRDAWTSLHKEIASLSTNGLHVVMDGADHMNLIYDKKNADQVAHHIRMIAREVSEK